MSKMELWEMALSPVCGKVRFAMEAKALDYRSRTHTPGLTDWKIKRVAPKVMVPTLVDGSAVIQGSDEILEHIESKKPEPNLLGVNDEEKDAISRYVSVAGELVAPLRTDVVVRLRTNIERHSREGPVGAMPAFIRVPATRYYLDKFSDKWGCEEEKIAIVRDKIIGVLRTLAPQLRPGRYLVGNRLTAADISVCELTLLFRPPSDHWLPVGPATRAAYHAGWLDSQISYPFEVWRDELYQAHRKPHSRF